MSAAQEYFDKTYITSAEILRDLGISRSSLLNARKRGMLPNSISLNDGRLFLWERAAIQKNLDAWRITLGVRKGR